MSVSISSQGKFEKKIKRDNLLLNKELPNLKVSFSHHLSGYNQFQFRQIKLVLKMNSLYPICINMLHGSKVIIYFL